MAINGEKLKSVKNLEKIVNKRRFEYTIRGLAATPGDALRAIATFLKELVALGDDNAKSILNSMKIAVAAGGKVEFALKGVYKGRVDADLELAKQFIAPHPNDESVNLSDLAEVARIEDWLLQGNAPKARQKRSDLKSKKRPTVENQVLEARNRRIKDRDRLTSFMTDDVALPVFTGNDSLEGMLNGLLPSWEGPDGAKFDYILSAASDSNKVHEVFKQALSSIDKAFRERRIGAFALPITTTGSEVSTVLKTAVHRGTVEEMLNQARKRWEAHVLPEFRYADIVAANPADAIRRFDEAIKALKKSLSGSRIGILIFPRLRQGVVEARLMAEIGRAKAIEIYEDSVLQIDLAKFTAQFCKDYPQVPADLASSCFRITNRIAVHSHFLPIKRCAH